MKTCDHCKKRVPAVFAKVAGDYIIHLCHSCFVMD